MNKKSIFASPAILYTLSLLAAILAIMIVYVCFLDEFSHSLLFSFLYLLLFSLIVAVEISFKKGKKEVVKAGTAALFTTAFFFQAMSFVDMLSLNYYYFFSGNYIATAIAFIAVALFFLYIFAYVRHFIINSSNDSDTVRVKTNRIVLIIVAILSLIQAGLIAYNDSTTGRNVELYLVLTYIMFFFIALILVCIETLINEFRLAHEKGNFKAFSEKLVGKAATRVASGKDKIKKVVKKTINKTTKK